MEPGMIRTIIAVTLVIVAMMLTSAVAQEYSPATAVSPRFAPLCDEESAPDEASDKVQINCRMEAGHFAPPAVPGDPASAVVVAYNMERGFRLAGQIEMFRTQPGIREADILLVGELDRGCTRTGYRNIPRELAQALGMNYVFGVEFVELPRVTGKGVNEIDTICEHGNAIFSRYPINNPEQFRHSVSTDWYIPPGSGRDNREPRLGGRTFITADIDFGGKPLRVYAVHTESSFSTSAIREIQAGEIIAHAAKFTQPVIVGGDFNCFGYLNDLRAGTYRDTGPKRFLESGYTDLHSLLKPSKRATTVPEFGTRVVIDLIFARGVTAVESGICPYSVCDPLSDHIPVWSRIRF